MIGFKWTADNLLIQIKVLVIGFGLLVSILFMSIIGICFANTFSASIGIGFLP